MGQKRQQIVSHLWFCDDTYYVDDDATGDLRRADEDMYEHEAKMSGIAFFVPSVWQQKG